MLINKERKGMVCFFRHLLITAIVFVYPFSRISNSSIESTC